MRLIDADELKEPVGSYNPVKWTSEYGYVIRLEDIDHAPTVETAVLSTSVLVKHEELNAPWCEQYVKDMIARNIAKALVKRIEIRSSDSDLLRMMKEFRCRVVIVTGTKMDGDKSE